MRKSKQSRSQNDWAIFSIRNVGVFLEVLTCFIATETEPMAAKQTFSRGNASNAKLAKTVIFLTTTSTKFVGDFEILNGTSLQIGWFSTFMLCGSADSISRVFSNLQIAKIAFTNQSRDLSIFKYQKNV
jgi:hypothetical protein